MGLLTKASSIKKKSDTWLDLSDVSATPKHKNGNNGAPSLSRTEEESAGFDESTAIGNLVTFIQEAVPNLHTPALIFSLLENNFQIEKGALLLLDSVHQQYNGIAYSGYDRTTQSRMRIPQESVSDLFFKPPEPIFLQKNEINFFKPFFSLREFSLINELVLYPFVHNTSDILGFLIISEAPVIFQKRNMLFSNFSTVFSQISQLIYLSREKLLKGSTGGKVKSNENLLQETETALQKADTAGSKLFFLTLSVVPILEKLRNSSEGVDLFQIQNDIIQIITNMMPEGDNIFLIDYGTLLIILSGRYHINRKLFFHQIRTAIQNLFSTLESIELDEVSFFEYPSDVSNAQDVIQRIFN